MVAAVVSMGFHCSSVDEAAADGDKIQVVAVALVPLEPEEQAW